MLVQTFDLAVTRVDIPWGQAADPEAVAARLADLPTVKGVPLTHNETSTGVTNDLALATEISILANFIPNDYLTFRHLPGHSRSWLLRCLRFHATCVMGTLLTLAISYTMHLIGLHATLGQAIALLVVTAFNFTMHHVFTYRHTDKPQVF